MQRASWLKQALAAGNEFHYLQQTPWKHNLKNGIAACALVGLYAGVIALGAVLPTWLYVPIGAFLLGCILFGFFVLVIHECSHSMFVLSKDRDKSKHLNNRIGTFVGDLLFTDYMSHWAREHVVHHLHPMESRDRQDLLRHSGRSLGLKYLLLLVPGVVLVNNPSRQYGFSLKRTLLGAAFFGSIACAGWVLVHWHVVLAIVFGWNVASGLTMTKVAQEHGSGLENEPDPYLRSRTYLYGSQKLTSPFNIHYHFEHHANFNVPWYLLPRYHQRIGKIMPAQLQPHFINRGWKQFYGQLAGTRPVPPVEMEELLRGTPQAVSA
jgi:fatty acid desaturase